MNFNLFLTNGDKEANKKKSTGLRDTMRSSCLLRFVGDYKYAVIITL
jgi:hypothetical protein